MLRSIVVVGSLVLGASVVVAQQDLVNQTQTLMKANGKNLGGVLSAMVKGERPYEQAAVDAALAQLDDTAKKLPTLFPASVKGLKADGDYYVVAEDLGEPCRVRRQDRELRQGGRRRQRQDQGSRQSEGHRSRHRQGMQRLPRSFPGQELVIAFCPSVAAPRSHVQSVGRGADTLISGPVVAKRIALIVHHCWSSGFRRLLGADAADNHRG